jgi:hypothetical protein
MTGKMLRMTGKMLRMTGKMHSMTREEPKAPMEML